MYTLYLFIKKIPLQKKFTITTFFLTCKWIYPLKCEIIVRRLFGFCLERYDFLLQELQKNNFRDSESNTYS